jgi:inosine/xanthosine triphosphatase
LITAIVGSENPVKVRAALKGMQAVYGITPVARGVSLRIRGLSDQPMTIEETLMGSRRRAVHSALVAECDFGIGLEGGLAKVDDEWFCISWATVADQQGRMFSAMGAAVWVAPALIKLVKSGLELGDAQDQYFGLTNSKQHTGLVGVITGDLVTRDDAFSVPVTTALCSMRMALELPELMAAS